MAPPGNGLLDNTIPSVGNEPIYSSPPLRALGRDELRRLLREYKLESEEGQRKLAQTHEGAEELRQKLEMVEARKRKAELKNGCAPAAASSMSCRPAPSAWRCPRAQRRAPPV